MFIVASKVKELVNGKGMMSAGDLAEGLSSAVEDLVTKAMERATANGRKTVRADDL